MRRSVPATLAAALVLSALPATAAAQLLSVDTSFGSGARPEGRFADPAGVATDDAGRVYVADTGAGRIEVFDSAEDGNTYLRSIGDGQLKQPVGVAVDLRNRIFVADAGADQVLQFDTFLSGAALMRSWGGSGTELGKMAAPRMVAPDLTGLAYNTEAGNVRVQWFTPKGGQMVPVSAFGTADPAPFDNPEGITLDTNAGQIYVTNSSPSAGAVRVYDLRGFMLGALAGPGAGNGELSGPRGIELDPLGRVIVADTANHRLSIFTRFAAGGGWLESFASPEIQQPVDVAFAPGAVLYVSDSASGRVFRLHYDDADTDGVLDQRDNCLGLSNPEQSDIDRDGKGDECDEDDDGDGLPDASDRCPTSRRGPDLNNDGCADPLSTVGGLRRAGFAGTAHADRRLRVAKVEVAIARVSGRRCSWYLGRGRFSGRRSCRSVQWIRARGTSRWIARVKRLRPGIYRVRSRAVQEGGIIERRRTARNARTFRVR
jgi:DNA-binding beta-propeller fold protein YncE